MKSDQSMKKNEFVLQRTAWLIRIIISSAAALPQVKTQAATNVIIWDTGSRLTGPIEMESRAEWKAVPSELFLFEANPPKAASDPGYYGREYSFKGDAVVENQSLIAACWSAKGRVVIYSKTGRNTPSAPFGRKIVEILPAEHKTSQSGKISHCEILRNAADEVMMEVSFSGEEASKVSAVLSFCKNEIIEIKPAPKMNGLTLLSPIEYGVVPGFIGDDLIVSPGEYESAGTLAVPAENVFVGLLKGGGNELVMTWPKGRQQLNLNLGNDPEGKRTIRSIDFDNDGQSFYLGALSAPGIWHREMLKPAYLEKDVPLSWKRPFPAKWKTQLTEGGARTTFAFRESKGEIWRGVPGSYNYPVWFDGNEALYHLSKKVPPKGDSLIYFLEGQDTPLSVSTPVDIMKATLGRQACESILDVAGQKLRTHHRRGGDGVHRACTCGCTEAIQAFFEAGKEVEMKEDIAGDLDDMIYFVQCHLDRINEYRRFADELIQFLGAKGKSSPELKPFLESLEQVAQRIPQEYGVQLENMKSLEHARELARRTLDLASKSDPTNLKAYMELLKAWRAMGGAQDYVLAQCHTITRKLFQEAGYGCVDQPEAVALAEEIRSRCRQCVRNPDGYEIWADY